MPHFFLHLYAGGKLIEDEVGSELPDLEAAKIKALDGVREIIADRVLTGKPLDGDEIRISNDSGVLLAVVPFLSATKVA